jgi:hypothetical protein
MTDRRMYPQGSGDATDAVAGNDLKQLRRRCTLAEINAGVELLPAKQGWKYRIVDWSMIAVGGAAAGATDARILGTRAGSSVALAAAAVAGLTQNTLLRAGAANAAILAGGDSFTPLDNNTPVTAGKTGATMTGPTSIDVILTYVAEVA